MLGIVLVIIILLLLFFLVGGNNSVSKPSQPTESPRFYNQINKEEEYITKAISHLNKWDKNPSTILNTKQEIKKMITILASKDKNSEQKLLILKEFLENYKELEPEEEEPQEPNTFYFPRAHLSVPTGNYKELEKLVEEWEEEVNIYWESISSDFSDEYVKREWISKGFSKEEVKEWVYVGLESSESELAEWLRDEKKVSSEWVINYGDIEKLREEFNE